MESLLLQVLCKPETRLGEPIDWELLLSQASPARLLARLSHLFKDRGLLERLPPNILERLRWAEQRAAAQAQALRWESRKIESLLSALDAPPILLKGAAYVLCDLPPARGRLYSDLDIMVPKRLLGEAEQILLMSGWETAKPDAYEQNYYRKWMHELPPFVHIERGTTLDVHHTILPETGRLRPDAEALMQESILMPGRRLAVLSPADMVLHSAAHLFQDGEIRGSLRDLLDLDDLLRHFGKEAGFWPKLVERARLHNLERPLFYALHYARALLGMPVQESVQESLDDSPSSFTLSVMDAAVKRALCPENSSAPSLRQKSAEFGLYLRSHWLRMPAHLLLPHLAHQAFSHWPSHEERDETDK